MALKPEDVEAGEAWAEPGGEEEVIGERCGGDADVVGVDGDAEAGAEVSEQRVARGGVGGGGVSSVEWVASDLLTPGWNQGELTWR